MAKNLLETVERLQRTLSDAAKASLDRRFGALFDKVYRKDVLWQAWRLVRNKNGGPGIDGQTCDYIENEIGVSVFLGELRDELRAGTYRPQPVKRCWIDTPGTTDQRPLGIPVVRDRVAHGCHCSLVQQCLVCKAIQPLQQSLTSFFFGAKLMLTRCSVADEAHCWASQQWHSELLLAGSAVTHKLLLACPAV